jgi:hypothetical protein
VIVSSKPSNLIVTLFLAGVGLLFALFPYLALKSVPQPTTVTVLAYSVPSLLCFSVAFLGSSPLKRAIAEHLPWFT